MSKSIFKSYGPQEKNMPAENKTVIKLPTIRRFPLYLRILQEYDRQGISRISSASLAEELSLESIVVRKDIATTNVLGKPKLGYDVKELIKAIRSFIKWDTRSEAALIGAGNLGSALIGYKGFEESGMHIAIGFDTDESKIGREIRGVTIYPLEKLDYMIPRLGLKMAILCVPGDFAQDITDHLISLGIKGIWNFTPVKIKTPDSVIVQNENLTSGLAVLWVKMDQLLD
jgi:redox-sensing transcriptional repressor